MLEASLSGMIMQHSACATARSRHTAPVTDGHSARHCLDGGRGKAGKVDCVMRPSRQHMAMDRFAAMIPLRCGVGRGDRLSTVHLHYGLRWATRPDIRLRVPRRRSGAQAFGQSAAATC